MADAPEPVKDDLLETLEREVKDILNSKKSSKADRLSAINAGTRLLAIRHRISGNGDNEGNFFG